MNIKPTPITTWEALVEFALEANSNYDIFTGEDCNNVSPTLCELLETSSVEVSIAGRKFHLALHVKELT